MRKTIEERFFDKIIYSGECWLWTGAVSNAGYGMLCDKNKLISAHRFSYKQFVGEIPLGMLICHRCDNTRCVNPKHLFAGTYQQNATDRVNKNRSGRMLGMGNAGSKLTDKKVVAIREKFAAGTHSKVRLSKEYGVSYTTIRNVILRENWGHI